MEEKEFSTVLQEAIEVHNEERVENDNEGEVIDIADSDLGAFLTSDVGFVVRYKGQTFLVRIQDR